MRQMILLASFVLVSCSDAPEAQLQDVEVEEVLSPAEQQAVRGLRDHCQACHGLGELKFLIGSDEEVWEHLFSERAPNSGQLWADEIQTVLNWPEDTPPDFDDPIEPGRDWMPKGIKRLEIAEDEVDGYPVRQLILDELGNQADIRRR